jgi:hypothetical protein
MDFTKQCFKCWNDNMPLPLMRLGKLILALFKIILKATSEMNLYAEKTFNTRGATSYQN